MSTQEDQVRVLPYLDCQAYYELDDDCRETLEELADYISDLREHAALDFDRLLSDVEDHVRRYL